MIKNEGKADRAIRIILGIILVWVAYKYLSDGWQFLVYVIAVASLITGLIGHCGLYSLLKINTNKKCDIKE